jgi:ankyrin repeat protein
MCHLQFGDTALIHAVRFGCIDCVRLLVELGADKEARNNVCVLICGVMQSVEKFKIAALCMSYSKQSASIFE